MGREMVTVTGSVSATLNEAAEILEDGPGWVTKAGWITRKLWPFLSLLL